MASRITAGSGTIERYISADGGDGFTLAMSDDISIIEALGLLALAQAHLTAPTVAATNLAEDEED